MGRLHNLADKETQHLVFTGPELFHLLGIVGNNLIHQGFEGPTVGDLPESLAFDNGIGIAFAFGMIWYMWWLAAMALLGLIAAVLGYVGFHKLSLATGEPRSPGDLAYLCASYPRRIKTRGFPSAPHGGFGFVSGILAPNRTLTFR